MRRTVFIIIFSIGSSLCFGQAGVGEHGTYFYTVKDCFKNPNYHRAFTQKLIKPNDVMKGSQMWRVISMENDQNNKTLNSNRDCNEIGLFEIIKFGLLERDLNAFFSDDFNEVEKSRLNPADILKKIEFTDTSSYAVFDSNGNEKQETSIKKGYLSGSDIKSYLLKEEWIINTQSGKSEKHIIGIAPIVYDKRSEKNLPLFWLYFEEWKELLASFVANNLYSFEGTTYLEVFTKRYFISQISKESNVFDRNLRATHKGYDVVEQSELIKEKLNNIESDLFQY